MTVESEHSQDIDIESASSDVLVGSGVPDGFQRLWTPHRSVYIHGENKPKNNSVSECPFCNAPQHEDSETLIVHRGKQVYTLMNLYPYNSGHLLVCPYRHVSGYIELSAEERVELGEETAAAIRTLKSVLHPQGFNLGMNQGDVAGAGISQHLHQHVIPRWLGDANFFPIVAQTKAIPQLLDQARTEIAAGWVS
ncbi:MAG: HIT domain-containing protein [Varibaculum sp.]|nr:HIT domain-containing protein [Varibaculum sp.]